MHFITTKGVKTSYIEQIVQVRVIELKTEKTIMDGPCEV